MSKGWALSTGNMPRGGLPRNSVERITDRPDMKYLFNLDVTLIESELCSLFINSSSGKLLELEVEPLLTALKCCQLLLVLFEVSMKFVKSLCFAFLIRVLVLFL